MSLSLRHFRSLFAAIATVARTALAVSLLAAPLVAQTSFLIADGPGNTYPMIEASGFNLETPDCKDGKQHIIELWNDELKKNVFQFTLHKNDDDRCKRFDRQRVELRGIGPAQQGSKGSTTIWRWKFRLPPTYKETGSFNHITQIKAYGNGHGSGAPIFTLTPRSGQMEVYLRGVKNRVPLSEYKGVWTEVYMKTKHDNAGSIEITLKRVSDGKLLQSWTGTGDTYDDGSEYGTCKFGNYRSLVSGIQDEDVLYSDFSITKGFTEAEFPTSVRNAIALPGAAALPRLRYVQGGVLSLDLAVPARFGLDVFDTRGGRVASLQDVQGAAGTNLIPLAEGSLPDGAYFIRRTDGSGL